MILPSLIRRTPTRVRLRCYLRRRCYFGGLRRGRLLRVGKTAAGHTANDCDKDTNFTNCQELHKAWIGSWIICVNSWNSCLERSEERRVGKECRWVWWREYGKK